MPGHDRFPRSFELDLEGRYLAHYATMLANARTLDSSLAVVLFALAGWVGLVAPWAMPRAIVFISASAVTVLSSMAWLHSGRPSPWRYRLSTWVSAGAIVATIIAIHVLIRSETGLLVAAVSSIALGYGMLQLRLREGLALNLLATTAVVCTLVVEGRLGGDLVSGAVFAGLGLFVYLLAGSYLESVVRRLFMLEVVSTEEATRDALTGVLNRRAIMAGASGVKRELLANPVAVVVADLDHFKQVNDRCGHETGDLALQACVKAWREVLRSDDLLARIGGEEFLVILPGTPATGAEALADRLRHATAAITFAELRVPLSASFGVSGWPAGEPLEVAFRRADAALYRAKESGRNRVELAA